MRTHATSARPPADQATTLEIPRPTLTGTPFGEIMKRAVLGTPGAIGGAFADAEGEMVDGFATQDPQDWAILTAHYGVVLAQLTSAFGTWHHGSPEYFIAQHARADILVWCVGQGYYALIAVAEDGGSAPLGTALANLRAAAAALRTEIG